MVSAKNKSGGNEHNRRVPFLANCAAMENIPPPRLRTLAKTSKTKKGKKGSLPRSSAVHRIRTCPSCVSATDSHCVLNLICRGLTSCSHRAGLQFWQRVREGFIHPVINASNSPLCQAYFKPSVESVELGACKPRESLAGDNIAQILRPPRPVTRT